MKAEDKLQILIFLLMLVNSLFVILGLSLFGCSIWIIFDKNNFITVLSTEDEIEVVAGGLFVIGLVIVGVSMLGCVGVYLENRCFIAVYMGMLFAIILGQVFITLLLLVKRNKIEAFLTESFDAIITGYGVNDTQTTWDLLDSVQQSAQCCGRRNASDWEMNFLIQTLNRMDVYPCSCFNGSCPVVSELSSEMYPFGMGSEIYSTGCGVKLRDWSETNIFVIVGMDLGLVAIQILQFVLGFHIYQNIGLKMKNRYPKNLLSTVKETPAPEPDLQQSNLEYQQPANHDYDQQLHSSDYDQEYAGASYQYQDQHYQHHPDPEDTSHLFDQQHHSAYAQEDSREAYDQYQHHHHHEPEPTSYDYDYKPDYNPDQNHTGQNYGQTGQNYDQTGQNYSQTGQNYGQTGQNYNQYQDSYYQHNTDQPYPQTGHHNQGFVHDSGNHFDD
ncbi:CD82 antigen [Astyanax mexicanus]|uniref:CD82 antigen n=1 Tax=Astyanax mexicanus TaxID=7994 RepID=UPI0020CB09D8|nr:CD82 antigen [Astyanax mexicanus]